MSNLQIGLAIAGGVVLAAVVAHSTWTSRKNKPRQADPMVQDTLIESANLPPTNFDILQEPEEGRHCKGGLRSCQGDNAHEYTTDRPAHRKLPQGACATHPVA